MKATIKVEDSEPAKMPIELTVAADALRQALGVDIDLKVVE